jgi:hypothetical protein
MFKHLVSVFALGSTFACSSSDPVVAPASTPDSGVTRDAAAVQDAATAADADGGKCCTCNPNGYRCITDGKETIAAVVRMPDGTCSFGNSQTILRCDGTVLIGGVVPETWSEDAAGNLTVAGSKGCTPIP